MSYSQVFIQMNSNVLSLIFAYKEEFERLERLIKNANEIFGSCIDIKFRNLDDVINFREVLETEISNRCLIVLENRCPLCHSFNLDMWSYSETTKLTYDLIVKFVIYMRQQGIMCHHEKLYAIKTCSTLCVLVLNVAGNETEATEAEP